MLFLIFDDGGSVVGDGEGGDDNDGDDAGGGDYDDDDAGDDDDGDDDGDYDGDDDDVDAMMPDGEGRGARFTVSLRESSRRLSTMTDSKT